ncbi:MAG: GHMP kinase [Acidobacteria bacterium]|nr:GHMP kinase [Acidobacteriota bacterium]
MIITRTPFRISFFGGGSDYPDYFRQYGGAVLATAIDKSAYHSVTHFHSQLFDYSIRIAYRQVECVSHLDDLKHAPFRECLRSCGITRDVEVNYTGELPSFTGLGTSSSFVVGLLNALHSFQGRKLEPLDLAYEAIRIERDVLGECVGCQDQALAAIGGLAVVEFLPDGEIRPHPVILRGDRKEELQQHMMLFHTGIHRRAAEMARRQMSRLSENTERIRALRNQVDQGYGILTGQGPISAFGELLHEAWQLKQELDTQVGPPVVCGMYHRARTAGALGGKLLGAGGGGFLLLFVPPERQDQVRDALQGHHEIPVQIEAPGSHVLYATEGIVAEEEILPPLRARTQFAD